MSKFNISKFKVFVILLLIIFVGYTMSRFLEAPKRNRQMTEMMDMISLPSDFQKIREDTTNNPAQIFRQRNYQTSLDANKTADYFRTELLSKGFRLETYVERSNGYSMVQCKGSYELEITHVVIETTRTSIVELSIFDGARALHGIGVKFLCN